MITINWIGGSVFIINIFLTIILLGVRKIGIKRSAAISGWISLLLGGLILVMQKGAEFITASMALIFGLVVVFAIILIIVPALMPQKNMSLLRHPIKFFMKTGYFIGYLMGLILAFL